MPTTITICRTCRYDRTCDAPVRDGMRFLKRVEDEIAANPDANGVHLRAMRCMACCDKACAAQIAADGKMTYVFFGLDAEHNAADLVAFARSHERSADGVVPFGERPEAIKKKIGTRIAPLTDAAPAVETTWDDHDENA